MLTTAVIVGQILSAGGMALRMGLPAREALTVGVGMCGRAELAFILASLALAQGAIDQAVFSVLIFTAFVLNLFTPLALKGCAVLLQGKAAHREDATRGLVQIDKFDSPAIFEGRLPHALPNVEGGVVVYGYGPEVDALLSELASRGLPTAIIEEDEAVARRLLARGQRVVHAKLAEEELDLAPLARARALVANGEDDADASLAMSAREQGFTGPIVALIDNPHRRGPMLLAGATAAFTPTHVLAAALAARASARMPPGRVPGSARGWRACSRWAGCSRWRSYASTTPAHWPTKPSPRPGCALRPAPTSSASGWTTRSLLSRPPINRLHPARS